MADGCEAKQAPRSQYENPLVKRYASKEMSYIWSPAKKFSTWRRLWLALAESEKELGIPISEEQLEQMRAHLDDINYEFAEAKEKQLRHDVMSHIHAFGEQCPAAMPIIHLGATSCYVVDNTELIQMKEGMALLQRKMAHLISHLAKFSGETKAHPTLGFTHFQPAQLVTVGKRACLWLQDFVMDFQRLTAELTSLPMRGVKGTTGTQASFLELFGGDHGKVKALDAAVAERMAFSRIIAVSGQTYTRKLDFLVLSVLSSIAQSAYKMGSDIRLLANRKELEEPFGKNQVGSSAMAYKRNPMRSERMCSLARFVISLTANTAHTASSQWLERTLDDSANRRLVLAEAFLATDVVLTLANNVVDGIQLWPNVIRKNVMSELPFMATENILMECVKAGGDRQELHEVIREHSMAAGLRVKQEGADNDLLQRIAADARFSAVHASLDDLVDPANFTGRSAQQVEEFLASEVAPLLEEHAALLQSELTDAVAV